MSIPWRKNYAGLPFKVEDRRGRSAERGHSTLVHTRREEEFCDRLSSRATFNGFTALHYAVLNDNLSVINLLIEHGADPLLENEQGHLPSAYSLQQRKEILFQFEKNVRSMNAVFHSKGITPPFSAGEEIPWRTHQNRTAPTTVGTENQGAYRGTESCHWNCLCRSVHREREREEGVFMREILLAIRRKESGWTSDESPLVFLFLGSSGVGKTELAKQIAKYLNGEKNQARCFIRIDMSEYQEKHEVSKLIGAPPGYESLLPFLFLSLDEGRSNVIGFLCFAVFRWDIKKVANWPMLYRNVLLLWCSSMKSIRLIQMSWPWCYNCSTKWEIEQISPTLWSCSGTSDGRQRKDHRWSTSDLCDDIELSQWRNRWLCSRPAARRRKEATTGQRSCATK